MLKDETSMYLVPSSSPIGAGEASRTASAESGSSRAARLRLLIDTHSGLATRALRARGVGNGEIDDALQMVFMVVARRLDDIEEGRESGFVLATSFRVASRVHRGVRRRRESGEELSAEVASPQAGPEQLVEQRQALGHIQKILGEMTSDLAEVFILFEVEQRSTLEIAGDLGLPKGTVQSRLRRAREQFRAKAARLNLEGANRK